eukprot:COSAG06_NODE_511_length_14869_cov_115.791063_8_plen_1015_part_00
MKPADCHFGPSARLGAAARLLLCGGPAIEWRLAPRVRSEPQCVTCSSAGRWSQSGTGEIWQDGAKPPALPPPPPPAPSGCGSSVLNGTTGDILHPTGLRLSVDTMEHTATVRQSPLRSDAAADLHSAPSVIAVDVNLASGATIGTWSGETWEPPIGGDDPPFAVAVPASEPLPPPPHQLASGPASVCAASSSAATEIASDDCDWDRRAPPTQQTEIQAAEQAAAAEEQAGAVPQPDDQAAFIRAFAATTVVQETLRRRSKSQKISGRVPTSIAAIERRWFAGKHTVQKAQKKAALLLPELDRIGASDTDLALAGTAAMFELAAQATGMVQIEPSSKAPGCDEVRLAIASRRRGRPSKQAAAAGASSPGGRSAPGADSESGWTLIPEDHSVFSIGVRRHLREHGWTCPPWDDTGHGTCTKDWRNLVDNKRIQLAKRPKGTPVTKTLRSDTIAKWDARAQKPGYTVALCKAVVDFRDARQADDTADDAAVSAGGEMQRLYYVDSTVATACRQFAEQRARVRSSSVDPVPYLSVKTEHPQAQTCNADQQPAGSKVDQELDLTHSVAVAALPAGVETAAAAEEKVPWTTQEEAWVSGSPWSDTDYMHLMINSTSSSGGSSTESGGSNAGGSSTGSNSPWSGVDVDVESFPMPDLWDDDGGSGAGNFVDGAAASGSSSDELWDDWGDGGGGGQDNAGAGSSSSSSRSSISGASSESSFGSASADAAAFQPKRSLSPGGGRDHDDGGGGSAAAPGVPPAKVQRTLAAVAAPTAAAAKRRGASKTSAAACVSAGAVALAFILLVSAGQFSTNQQTSMDPHAPRIEPETERWQCVPEPSSVLPHWTDSELCRSDPKALFPCTIESRQEASCTARHGVIIGRICRCDGCFTGGECIAWEKKGDDQEPCSKDSEEIAVGAIAASDSGGGSQNKTTCQCTGSGNAIACSNGEVRHCGAGKECTARVWSSFDYGDWSAACKDAPLVPRPQWRQQLRGAAYAHRGSPAIMWLACNSTLYLYLFASGE